MWPQPGASGSVADCRDCYATVGWSVDAVNFQHMRFVRLEFQRQVGWCPQCPRYVVVVTVARRYVVAHRVESARAACGGVVPVNLECTSKGSNVVLLGLVEKTMLVNGMVDIVLSRC